MKALETLITPKVVVMAVNEVEDKVTAVKVAVGTSGRGAVTKMGVFAEASKVVEIEDVTKG